MTLITWCFWYLQPTVVAMGMKSEAQIHGLFSLLMNKNLYHLFSSTRLTFARNIIRLVLEGMTFSSIERFIATRRAEYVAPLSLQMHSVLIKYELRHVPSNGLPNFLTKPYPSNDLFCHCFLQDFIENYFSQMASESTDGYISIDHTFKVAANLGYDRPVGRWISQYGSLLIVLNNCVKVIAWQFTSSTSIDEVKPMLSLLKMSQTSNLQTIYVDNCELNYKAYLELKSVYV